MLNQTSVALGQREVPQTVIVKKHRAVAAQLMEQIVIKIARARALKRGVKHGMRFLG